AVHHFGDGVVRVPSEPKLDGVDERESETLPRHAVERESQRTGRSQRSLGDRSGDARTERPVRGTDWTGVIDRALTTRDLEQLVLEARRCASDRAGSRGGVRVHV